MPRYKMVDGVVMEITQAEEDALAASISLDSVKADRVGVLARETKTYVETHYAQHRQQTFSFLYASGGANRKAEIQEIWDWIEDVFDYYYSKEDEILAAGTKAAVAAVTWDLSSFDASDPLKEIRVVKEIAD